MAESQFVYVTFIRTTPEKLWRALIEPEFTRQFWVDTTQESEWKPGSPWRLVKPNGDTADSGEVVEIELPSQAGLEVAESPVSRDDGGGLFAPDLRT